MGSIPTILFSCLRHEDFWIFFRNGRAFGTTSKLILLYQYKICLRNENLMFLCLWKQRANQFRQGVAIIYGTHLQHLMWPCWFILLFISGVPSARRFYFFIRSVRAFGTTQSLLFISFTKPSMTTLPSSSSKVKLCFLFEWYSRAQGTKT